MHICLMTDLEGVSGVDREEQMRGDGYRFACERLMADVNAAVAGAFEGGATAVSVIDGHGSGDNFLLERLSPRARRLSIAQWQEATARGDFDGYMEVGCHAMAGTLDAFLDHTQSSVRIFAYTYNGVMGGEIAQGALYMGAFGVPMVMVSGDEAACREARELLGDIAAAPVKTGVGRNRADCLPLAQAEARIRAAAARGVGRIARTPPCRATLPLEVRVTFTRSDYADAAAAAGGVERLDARTVRKTVAAIGSYGDVC